MRLKKVCIVLLLGTIVLTGCDQRDIASKQDGIDEQDETDRQDENDEVYYCDIVSASVSKYPELNTTDIAIDHHGFGPMIVSPYASVDVVRAVTHVIRDTDISTYCYGNRLYDDKYDDFTGYDFEEIYEIIQSRVDESRLQSDTFNQQLIANLESDTEINISPSGEYYYILEMENFDESAMAIKESVDRQSEIFDYDMREKYSLYFICEGRDFTGGYRGLSYAIYLDTYSPDNKIHEYYYWMPRNEWVNVYVDLYISSIYDYTKISEKLSEHTDYRPQLICSSGSNQDMNFIRFKYRMWSEEFEPDEAIQLAYEVYTNVRNANEEHNTYRIYGLDIDINNFTEYYKEYNKVRVLIPFDEEYSLEEFKKIILDNVETAIDSEPV